MSGRFDPAAQPLPIVQAPMAGGPSTRSSPWPCARPAALGFLAAGYKRAEAVREEIATVRAGTSAPFGVNVFVPSPTPADPDALRDYLARLAPEAERHGAELGEPRFDDDDWERKLELVCDERIPVVSFVFGCPAADVVDRLHSHGAAVWVTVTDVEEALEAERRGRRRARRRRGPRRAAIAGRSSTTRMPRARACWRCCGWLAARLRCR